MIDGKKYEASPHGRFYQPADYHGTSKSKQKKKHTFGPKTQWIINKGMQYDVFLAGEKQKLIDDNGIFSLQDNCADIFGVNGERIAFFPAPPQGTVEWHGYPILSEEEKLTDDMIDSFYKKQIVDFTIYKRILERKI